VLSPGTDFEKAFLLATQWSTALGGFDPHRVADA